jgi:hypothetical protein
MKVTFANSLAMRLISTTQMKCLVVEYAPFEAVTCSVAQQAKETQLPKPKEKKVKLSP